MSSADSEVNSVSLPYQDPSSAVEVTRIPMQAKTNKNRDGDVNMIKVEFRSLKYVLLWPFQLFRLIYITLGIFYFGKSNFLRWHESDGDFDFIELPPLWKLIATPALICSTIFSSVLNATNSMLLFTASKIFGGSCCSALD